MPDRAYARTCRSYLIASGQHTLTIEYTDTVLFANISSGPREISLVMRPDQVYRLRALNTAFIRTIFDPATRTPTVVTKKLPDTVEGAD